jgi:hypothetical protein
MQPPEDNPALTEIFDRAPLTAEHLSVVLRDYGSLRKGVVTKALVAKRVQTTVSHLWFLIVNYSSDATPGLPNRLVVKWPVVGSAAPEQGTAEPTFYRDLAPHLSSPPIVRCLAAAPNADGLQWLVLEDLRSTHTNPPWPRRPPDHALVGAVSVLAALHAHWWDAPTLGSVIGTLHTEANLRAMVAGIAAHLPGFFGSLGDTISDSDRSVLETVFSSSLAPWLRLADQRALTVTHGDAHTWNFLFPRSDEGDPYLVDWQLWHLDVGARDLAFMIALHWDPAVRARLEYRLLEFYHQRLINEGIADYPFDALWLDYRRCAVRNLTYPIIQWARGLPSSAWRERLDCALAAYRDLDGSTFL